MGWNEKKYRREINRSKEQLTDKETFLSARYRELLRKMASQITEKRSLRRSHVCGFGV